MNYTISLPSKPRVISEEESKGVFEINGLYPGYGIVVGNSIRRMLLSSLPGAAITRVKIEGINHEFSTLPGVKEDIVTILLNLKQLRFQITADEPQTLVLNAKGQKKLTGKDLEVPSTVTVITKHAPIATLTEKNATLHAELIAEKGLGYVPRELAQKEKVEIGMITLDAFFSPVVKVNFEVEDMRVGDRTDYNRVRFFVETDGSITPRQAFEEATKILVQQFTTIGSGFVEQREEKEAPEEFAASVTEEEIKESAEEEAELGRVKIEDLPLSSRTINALHEGGIKTVGGLLRKDSASLSALSGIGEKAIQEIKIALGNMGLLLE